MQIRQSLRVYLLLAVSFAIPVSLPAQTTRVPAAAERDGSHDFDFELGGWKMRLQRRRHPLAGSDAWNEFDADSWTQKIWGGRAQIEQFEANGPPNIEGLTLRLYDPQSRQWRLYWATSTDGSIGAPMIGEFRNGTGEFFDQEIFHGKAIYVRFVWSGISRDSAHFVQSFSDDGGKTWEPNWITQDTRVKDELAEASAARAQGQKNAALLQGAAQKTGADPGGQHDFDFEFGAWKTHLRRLLHPLTGSHDWVEMDGISKVRKIWNGRANLGELEVGNASSHIEGLSLRLYNPQAHQWNIYWANSRDGVLSAPMVGQFKNGRGEFFDQENFAGKAIFVRFIFSDITPASFRLEQAFSADGGQSWEANWIATFTRQKS